MKAIKVKKLYNGKLGESMDNAVVIIDGDMIKNVITADEFELMDKTFGSDNIPACHALLKAFGLEA